MNYFLKSFVVAVFSSGLMHLFELFCDLGISIFLDISRFFSRYIVVFEIWLICFFWFAC